MIIEQFCTCLSISRDSLCPFHGDKNLVDRLKKEIDLDAKATWITRAANELASHFSFGSGPDNYVTDEQRQNVTDNYAAIIARHYDMKDEA